MVCVHFESVCVRMCVFLLQMFLHTQSLFLIICLRHIVGLNCILHMQLGWVAARFWDVFSVLIFFTHLYIPLLHVVSCQCCSVMPMLWCHAKQGPRMAGHQVCHGMGMEPFGAVVILKSLFFFFFLLQTSGYIRNAFLTLHRTVATSSLTEVNFKKKIWCVLWSHRESAVIWYFTGASHLWSTVPDALLWTIMCSIIAEVPSYILCVLLGVPSEIR